MLQDRGPSYFKWNWHPGYREKSSLASFLPFSSNTSHFPLFFCNLYYFCFVFSSNLFFYPATFFHLLLYFMKFSRRNVFALSCLWYSFIKLSNFVWAKSFIELCFSCFTVNSWFDFREAAFARGSHVLMLDKATEGSTTDNCRNRETTSYIACSN